jgi:hypothetical protein
MQIEKIRKKDLHHHPCHQPSTNYAGNCRRERHHTVFGEKRVTKNVKIAHEIKEEERTQRVVAVAEMGGTFRRSRAAVSTPTTVFVPSLSFLPLLGPHKKSANDTGHNANGDNDTRDDLRGRHVRTGLLLPSGLKHGVQVTFT